MTISRIIRNSGGAVQGGGAASSMEEDWQARIADSVWFHDFRSVSEVNAFRFSGGVGGGNDPNAAGTLAANVRHVTSDGMASGCCLEVLRPAGTGEPQVWWRPFSPLTSPGNGKDTDDPGDGGAISAKSYAATQGGSQLLNWNEGWYGHPTYADADPSHFDGNDIYLQVVCKMDHGRIKMGNNSTGPGAENDLRVGKFLWISTTEGSQSLSNGEHVIWSWGHSGNQGALNNYLRVYSLGVNGIGAFDPLDQEDPSGRIQPGSDVADDWSFSGDWDVVLIHLRPGLINTTTGADATLLEIWAAHEGETSYTKIWSQVYGLSAYEARNGLQAFIASAYNNGKIVKVPFRHRWAQIIQSKQSIACPQAWPTGPAWRTEMVAGRWNNISNNTISDVYAPDVGQMGVTGQRAIIDSANGGAFCRNWGRHGSLASWGGGHTDYFGNEIYAFDLATGYWYRQSEPFPNPPADNATGLYSDGSPAITHTSQTLTYNPVTNEIVAFHVQVDDNFNHITKFVTYDRDDNTWRAGSSPPDQIPVFGFVAYDSDEGRYWVNGGDTGDGLSSYVPGGAHGNSGTWTNHGDPMGQFLNAMAAYDPINKIVVFTQFRSSNTIYGFSVNGGTPGSRVTLTQSGKPSTGQSHGWCYSPKRQAFLYWNGGGNVYEVKKGSGTWDVATWTWTLLTDGGNSVSPIANSDGVYGRFGVVTYEDEDDEYAVTWNSTTGPVSAFKVP